jgi:L-ascorbate metabolism protein UlaG (beta-lactamase superfamily)
LEITWVGLSCFRIAERNRITVVTDPFSESIGLPSPTKLKGDVVTVSHDVPGHNFVEALKSDPHILRGPGEYEIGGVFITGVALHDVENNRQNVAYLIDYDGLTVLHLGDLSHVPKQSDVEALGQVSILMIPVGGGNGLRAEQAAEVVALFEPYFVIPMHYQQPGLVLELDPVDKFLTAMGVSKAQESDTLKVTVADTPEQPQVVVLTPQTQA